MLFKLVARTFKKLMFLKQRFLLLVARYTFAAKCKLLCVRKPGGCMELGSGRRNSPNGVLRRSSDEA